MASWFDRAINWRERTSKQATKWLVLKTGSSRMLCRPVLGASPRAQDDYEIIALLAPIGGGLPGSVLFSSK